MTARTLWKPAKYPVHYRDEPVAAVQVDTPATGVLVASLTENGLHAPVLDIDFEARLAPSKTPGHYHLYLDREMPWWRYRLLLWALKVAGIIEPGFYKGSVRRRMSRACWYGEDATDRAG